MFCITNYLHFKRIVMFIFRVTWICHTFCCRFSNFLHLSFTPCFYDEPRFCLFYHYCLWFCMSRFLLTVFFFSTAITRRLHGWWGVRSTIGWHLSLKVRGYYGTVSPRQHVHVPDLPHTSSVRILGHTLLDIARRKGYRGTVYVCGEPHFGYIAPRLFWSVLAYMA